MPALGSQERPVIVKVTSEKMAKRVAEICNKNGLHFIAGFEPVADLTDLKRAIKDKIAPKNIYDLCPCGSGLKYKFCCARKEVELDL
jgi:uncharacterized protein YecA (UPF0149 family)